jgi:hypothetical protein
LVFDLFLFFSFKLFIQNPQTSMNKEKIIAGITGTPKYGERADVRAVVDEAVAELNAAADKPEIKRILDALKAKLAATLGLPPPARLAPDRPAGVVRNVEQLEIIDKLRVEYGFQMKTLSAFDVLERVPGVIIVGIDGRNHRVPTLEQIDAGMEEYHFKKYRQGFTKLLLVPFGMPLSQLAQRAGKKDDPQIRVNFLDNVRKPINQNPVDIQQWDITSDQSGKLVYYPKKFTPYDAQNPSHGGKTKQEVIGAEGCWQVLLVEPDAEIPREEETAEARAGRERIRCNKSSKDYLNMLGNGMYEMEEGMTPESALVMHMSGMMEGRPYDARNWNLLLGSYLTELYSGVVPVFRWDPGDVRALLAWFNPGDPFGNIGCRSAVRIRLKTT